MALRWEWRMFGDDLGAAGRRLEALPVERVTDSDETYLLSAGTDNAVKLRDGLMDVKHLLRVDDRGLELWEPVMKAPLPLSAANAAAVLEALGAPAAPDREAYALEDLVGASDAVVAVPVHKTRRHVKLGGCMAELTDLRAGDRATRTIAVESEQPAEVVAAVHDLGLETQPNVNVPRGLRALLD